VNSIFKSLTHFLSDFGLFFFAVLCPFFVMGFVSQTICWDWLWATVLLITAWITGLALLMSQFLEDIYMLKWVAPFKLCYKYVSCTLFYSFYLFKPYKALVASFFLLSWTCPRTSLSHQYKEIQFRFLELSAAISIIDSVFPPGTHFFPSYKDSIVHSSLTWFSTS
jgi:hypothetical protein